MSADKRSLRASLRAHRAGLDPAACAEALAPALARVMASSWWHDARVIAAYLSLPDEPDLGPLLDRARADGRVVALPVVVARGAPLELRAHRPGDPLLPSRFGVREPGPGCPVVAPETVDLVVVPALAVDRAGIRLGYGGGFYDRTLPSLTKARRVWVGLDAQVVDALPHEPHDVAVHDLVTPSGWWVVAREGAADAYSS